MGKMLSFTFLLSILSCYSYAEHVDLGLKSKFSYKHSLMPKTLRELTADGANVCMGGDVHSVPSRMDGNYFFVVGFYTEGDEKLVIIKDNESAKELLHCIMDENKKSKHYYLPKNYESEFTRR